MNTYDVNSTIPQLVYRSGDVNVVANSALTITALELTTNNATVAGL